MRTTKLLALATGGLLLLAAAAPVAHAGAIANDLIWVKGKDTPIPGVVIAESIEGIKLAGGPGWPITSVVRIDYFDAPDAFKKGLDSRQQTAYPAAIKSFESALRNPTKAREFWLNPACRYYIALSYLDDGTDLAAAEAKFKEFLELHKDSRYAPDAILGLGRTLAAQKKYDAAIAQFKKLLDLGEGKAGWDDWLATAYLWQSQTYLDADQAENALRASKRVLDILADPRHDLATQARKIQAKVLLKQNEPDKAVTLLKAIIKDIAPRVAEEVEKGGAEVRMQRTEAQCYNSLGDAYLALHAKGKKEEDLREALLAFMWTVVLYPRSELEAERAEALYKAAECFRKLKQGARATDLNNELAEKYPNSPYARLLGAGKATPSRKEADK